MACDQRMAVKFDAFAVGMTAQVGGLTEIDVDALLTKAEQLLGSGDQLTRAICGFATQYQLARYQPDKLAELGRHLVAYVNAINTSDPPDLGRKDIHG